MKVLYCLYALSNRLYNHNRATKTCINWLVGNLSYSTLGQSTYLYLKKRYLTFPKRVQVETTSYCNAKCIMCPQPIMPRRNRHMEGELFKKIMSELSEHRDTLKVLSLHFLGEPLMDPMLFERVREAKAAGIKEVQLNTNAQLLDEEKAASLLRSGIDAVTFSLGGLETEVQEDRRVGTRLSTVEKNIDHFIRLAQRYRVSEKRPKLVIYTIKHSSQDMAWKPIVRKYKGLVDSIAVISQNNWGGRVVNVEKEQNLTNYRIPCPLIFSTMTINVDGKVNLCCIDYADREIMGDLRKESIYEVWNGKMEQYRLLHMKNKAVSIPLCKECSLYR